MEFATNAQSEHLITKIIKYVTVFANWMKYLTEMLAYVLQDLTESMELVENVKQELFTIKTLNFVIVFARKTKFIVEYLRAAYAMLGITKLMVFVINVL